MSSNNTITLPEITIEGRADNLPQTPSDWLCDGFIFGWNHPDKEPEAPAPLNEESLSAYMSGVKAGKDARKGIEANFPQSDTDEGQAVVNDLGGESYDELEKAWKEAWDEFLNHREDPHIEAPEIEIVP